MPRGMGTLYWQLNDCWPVVSWSSIDSHGRWKALHYMARRFYAPLLVSGVEDPARGTVEVHVTSDLPRPAAGKLTWTLTDLAGRALAEGTRRLRAAPRRSARLMTLRLAPHLKAHGARGVLLWLELAAGGEVVSTNLVTFARPKHLELAADPGLSARVRPAGEGTFAVTLRARRPALWAWLEIDRDDARWSDNFVHVRPGRPVELLVRPARPLTATQLRRRLVLRSLVDTCA